MLRFVNFEDLNKWMGEVDDVEQAVSFLMGERLLPSTMKCPHCQCVLHPKSLKQKRYPFFTCQKHDHHFKQSILKGTWFEGTHLHLRQVMNICLCFSLRMPYYMTEVCASVGDDKLSSCSISDWYNFCREICLDGISRRAVIGGKIGGAGRVIQIGECKIGRRKCERGRTVEGKWILGMIDQESKDFRLEICPYNKIDAETLFQLIDKHIDQASTIYTDCWKGYNGLMGRDFAQHLTVNHAYHFFDPIGNVHTNMIESQWRPMRQRLNRGGIRRDNIELHIDEFLWIKDCRKRNVEPFVQLIEDIRCKYPFE